MSREKNEKKEKIEDRKWIYTIPYINIVYIYSYIVYIAIALGELSRLNSIVVPFRSRVCPTNGHCCATLFLSSTAIRLRFLCQPEPNTLNDSSNCEWRIASCELIISWLPYDGGIVDAHLCHGQHSRDSGFYFFVSSSLWSVDNSKLQQLLNMKRNLILIAIKFKYPLWFVEAGIIL